MDTKFFVVTYPFEKNDYDLYACRQDTPIPTIEEVVEREKLSRFCLNGVIKEISMRKFLQLHHKYLKGIADSADDLIEWGPNSGGLDTWRWWHSAEEREWIEE